MALTLVTGPSSEPVTVSELKDHLRLDGSDDDGYLVSLIKAARQWFEGQTKRGVITQTWDYDIDYNWPWKHGQHGIDLPLNPVPAQTSPATCSITYVDSDGASQTLAQTQYTLVGRTHGSYIVPAYDVAWPSVRSVPEAITVRFNVGESSAPEDIKMPIIFLAAHWYENRVSIIHGLGAMTAELPYSIEAMVSPYRRAVF